MQIKLFLLLATLFQLIVAPGAGMAADKLFFASVGSGGLDGGYHRTASAICNAVHENHRAEFRCSPEVTQGSIYNLKGLANGELEFALVQSDWLHEAFTGGTFFSKTGSNKNLRTVVGLYVEAFTLLVRRDANISSFSDLVGKRVDIGAPTSGRRATMEIAMRLFGIKKGDLSLVSELPSSNILRSLCQGRIDAVALVVGHPSPLVAKAIKDCDAILISVNGPKISSLIESAPYYRKTTLSANLYNGQENEISTFGVKATLVTKADIPDRIVNIIAATIISEWKLLGKREPILVNTSLQQMQSNPELVPTHSGAQQALEKLTQKTN